MKQKKPKLKWANDEFDDFRSAGEDSEDANYKPVGNNSKPKPKNKAIQKKKDEFEMAQRKKEKIEEIE